MLLQVPMNYHAVHPWKIGSAEITVMFSFLLKRTLYRTTYQPKRAKYN